MPPAPDAAPPPLPRILVLISGSGTNLQALIDATRHPASAPALRASITHVISDRKDAYGLQRARAAHIPTTHHGILPYKAAHPDPSPTPRFAAARRAYDARLAELVLRERPALVVCAGFMRILTPACLAPLAAAAVPLINLHPALHGDLVGAGCIGRAWEEFVAGTRARTGVMVHHVVAEVDLGEPVCQREVEMAGCGSLEELEARIHDVEHVLIVEGAAKVLETCCAG